MENTLFTGNCAEHDLCIVKGDDKNYRLVFTVGTAPLNLTGYTVFFTLKDDLDDSDEQAKIQVIVTVHTDPTNGITNIPLTNVQTKIPTGNYVYDIQLRDPIGKITTVIRGQASVVYEVTDRIAAS